MQHAILHIDIGGQNRINPINFNYLHYADPHKPPTKNRFPADQKVRAALPARAIRAHARPGAPPERPAPNACARYATHQALVVASAYISLKGVFPLHEEEMSGTLDKLDSKEELALTRAAPH
jgi:hypothetical protein